MEKKGSNYCSYATELFGTLVVSMVISPLPKIVAEIKIGAVGRKFCLVSRSAILFLLSVKPFE